MIYSKTRGRLLNLLIPALAPIDIKFFFSSVIHRLTLYFADKRITASTLSAQENKVFL